MFNYLRNMFNLAFIGEEQGILFFISMYFFIFSSYALISQLKILFWSSTKGKLLHADSEHFGLDGHNGATYTAKALYKYIVNGVEYQGSRISLITIVSTGKTLSEGQLAKIQKYNNSNINVWYNPKKPHESILVKFEKFWFLFACLICVLSLILYPFKYHV